MRSDKDILLICIFTFVTVVAWVFIDFVKTTQTPVDTNVPKEMLAPLPPPIDTNIFQDLENRHIYE